MTGLKQFTKVSKKTVSAKKFNEMLQFSHKRDIPPKKTGTAPTARPGDAEPDGSGTNVLQ
ncbi:MAG: hypothetical protein K2G30_02270 [Muribaculaceae bacterium]|nr:hypothetical protein [Muribaculaceae bacterium]